MATVTTKTNQGTHRSFGVKFARIATKTLLYIILFILIILLFLQFPFVQNIIKKKVVAYLENKLDTRIEVGRLHVSWPQNIVLKDVYIEDKQKDTLLSGGSIEARLNLWDLAVNQEVNISRIELNGITAKIKRQLPDTTFNFQFIVDAFAPTDTTSTPADTSASAITLKSVELNNVRLVYQDVVSGTDMQGFVQYFDTKIDVFNPAQLKFDVPQTTIKGLTASLYQVKPLARPKPAVVDSMEAQQPISMDLDFKNVSLENVNIVYRNDVSATSGSFMIGELEVTPENIDLTNRIIELDELKAKNTNSVIHIGNDPEGQVVVQKTEQEAEAQADAGWKINIASIDMQNNQLRFDNDNMPRKTTQMDYAHLKADSFSLQAKDIVLQTDSIGGTIESASFKEQSGFDLRQLQATFLYSNKEAYLQDLYLETPGTELKRNAAIRYASIEALTNDIGNMEVELDLDESHLLVRDLLLFVPQLRSQPAFADPSATWYLNSRIRGKLSDLQIDELYVRGLRDTRVDINGRITGLPDMNNMSADIAIRNTGSSKRDLDLFIPKGTIPSNITIPQRFSVNGELHTGSGNVKTKLGVNSDMGTVLVNGTFRNVTDVNNAAYNANIDLVRFDIGKFIQNNSIQGPVSLTTNINGTGYDPATANAAFNGVINAATINNYTYRGLRFDGRVDDGKAAANTSIKDPNIDFALNATADLSMQYPSVKVTGMIDSIKLQPLNLTTQKMIYRGKIDADIPVTNPDDLQGEILLTQSLFVRDDQRLQLDTIELAAGRSDSGHFMRLQSDVMTARMEGEYKLSELGNIFQQTIQPYFAVAPGDSVVTRTPYDFTLNAYILDNPALKVFVPNLEQIDSVSVQSHFSNTTGWNAVIKAPRIDMGAQDIRNLQLTAGTGVNAIQVNGTMQQFSSGKDIRIDNISLNASLANNTIDFNLASKDRNNRDKYRIGGLLRQPSQGNYELSLKNDSLLLNYDAWAVSANNRIRFINGGINANDFVLSKNGQQLSINSTSEITNAPLNVDFSNFRLSTVGGFVQSDSNFVNGVVNGKVTFTNIMTDPVFVGDLNVTDLSYKGDTVGNVKALVNNRGGSNVYAADIALSGRGNDAKLTGNYYMRPVNSNYDFDLDIRSLSLATVQAFSNDKIVGAKGSLSGKLDVTGTLNRPVLNGDLAFNQAGFNFKMLNSYFTVDQEKIHFDERGLTFNRFEIKDSLQNPLIVNGTVGTTNFTNYNFDLSIRATNFRALNSTKRDNRLFYGQLYFNTNMTVKGTESAPVVDGRLVINDKTKMTIVLPQEEPGVVEREGVVEFVDMDAPLNDSLFLAAYDSLNMSGFSGMDITLTVEVVREAEFSLIIDEGNGDFLNVKGEASLAAGIDPSGKINLTGSYEIEEGAYEITFNFLRRRFNIQKGSRIEWEGQPTDATVDVQATYVANTAPLDLVKNQLGDATAFERTTYLQKLPFDVNLDMQGQLMRPQITFDIVLPEGKNYVVSGDIVTNVRTRLEQLRQDPGEMNKQVFSLLLLNRFLADNPFNSSVGGPSASTLARQSVSKLLTEQLNKLAGDLIAGVDLNFDVVSSEDYTTGERRDRTDLNVGLSKRLLNDRLTVSIGSNFGLEGPQQAGRSNNIAGNIAVDYRISKDNRYLLRAYRKNEYEGVIDGYIIETGVGFIITVDYNRFREIFLSRKEREERRERRRQQRELDKQQNNQAVSDSTRVSSR